MKSIEYHTPSVAPYTQVVLPRPEFFRLPKVGYDPYFGLGRSFYYEAEQRGWFKLVRIIEEGSDRGITLVPYAEVSKFLHLQMQKDGREKACHDK